MRFKPRLKTSYEYEMGIRTMKYEVLSERKYAIAFFSDQMTNYVRDNGDFNDCHLWRLVSYYMPQR